MANKLKEFHDAVVEHMKNCSGGTAPVVAVTLPTQSGTLTYSGSAQTPTWSGYDSTQLIIGGTTSATNAGTYTATFTPQTGFTWTDGTSNAKNATWTIGKAEANLTVTKSSVSAKVGADTIFKVTTNSGGELSVSSSDESVATATISDKTVTVTGVCVGSATITVAQAASANCNAATSVSCTANVKKGTPNLTLSKSSTSLDLGSSTTFTITTKSDGKLSVSSSETNVATATLNGNVVTITGVGEGVAAITVTQTAGTNYSPATSICTVAVPAFSIITDSWETISIRAKAGTAANYYKVGDCKEVVLNGKIGDCLELDNEKLYVFILHINYPMNGTPDNNIIWGGFKTADGTDVALVDSKYNMNMSQTNGTICFNVNHWHYDSHGGWKGADFRYDILGATSTQPSDYGKTHTASCVGYNATAETLNNPKANTLLAALPADFRGALRLWSRWIDAKDVASNVEANIEETIDAITLLTEWEVHGKRSYANQYEQNHQTQMDYYANGNGKRKRKFNNTSSAVWWWVASPYYNNYPYFCAVYTDGSAFYDYAATAYGIAPAFKV